MHNMHKNFLIDFLAAMHYHITEERHLTGLGCGKSPYHNCRSAEKLESIIWKMRRNNTARIW